MKSGLSQNPDLQGVQIWQMGEQFGRDVAELRALQRPICINQKKIFRFFPCNKAVFEQQPISCDSEMTQECVPLPPPPHPTPAPHALPTECVLFAAAPSRKTDRWPRMNHRTRPHHRIPPSEPPSSDSRTRNDSGHRLVTVPEPPKPPPGSLRLLAT